ncbi:hypothetical protein ACQPUI_19085 [Clostridium butyricum]|uniref:hypothetical protein n=1 Tax=Clostridium butyricum TaxID=1492 RepID=UPI003D33303D
MIDFNPNLHIIYTDESNNFSYSTCTSCSIASIVTSQEYYINTLESDWNSLRQKYKVANGICLHFTDIKALLNPKYYTRLEKDRNLDMENIFFKPQNPSDKPQNPLGTSKMQLDTVLLYNFYCDVIDFIKNHDFTIIVSNYFYLKSKTFPTIAKKHLNSDWYILFKNHLDDLIEYALREKYKNSKLKFQAKLRYDGDFGLSNKNDLRDAFSHSITSGTARFDSKTARTCFDELRFISKKEVGYCSNCTSLPSCTNKNYSHAGNEIIDFIAAYAGKYISKAENIKHFKDSLSKTTKAAKSSYEKSVTIKILDKQLSPLDAIIPKIYMK